MLEELPQMPERLLVTHIGGPFDGQTMDSTDPRTWNGLPDPAGKMLQPSWVWINTNGGQTGETIEMPGFKHLRAVMSDESPAEFAFFPYHRFTVIDRRDEDGTVHLTMQHSHADRGEEWPQS